MKDGPSELVIQLSPRRTGRTREMRAKLEAELSPLLQGVVDGNDLYEQLEKDDEEARKKRAPPMVSNKVLRRSVQTNYRMSWGSDKVEFATPYAVWEAIARCPNVPYWKACSSARLLGILYGADGCRPLGAKAALRRVLQKLKRDGREIEAEANQIGTLDCEHDRQYFAGKRRQELVPDRGVVQFGSAGRLRAVDSMPF